MVVQASRPILFELPAFDRVLHAIDDALHAIRGSDQLGIILGIAPHRINLAVEMMDMGLTIMDVMIDEAQAFSRRDELEGRNFNTEQFMIVAGVGTGIVHQEVKALASCLSDFVDA